MARQQDTWLNIEGICKEFNMEENTTSDINIEPTDKSPEDVIRENISRANMILDIITSNMNQGNITARIVEVAGQIINNVTAASKELLSNDNYTRYIKLKDEIKALKEREVIVKEQKAAMLMKKQLNREGKGKTINQNIIVSSREDILKLIGNSTKELPNETQ